MKILMVCLGNICRSPLAQGILESYASKHDLDWVVDSAGTSGWHDGDPPDQRSIRIAKANDIDISNQSSRKVRKDDLEDFDLILAMDQDNYNKLRSLDSEKINHNKIKLILNYVYPGENRAVPDPYYNDNFQLVYDLLEQASAQIISRHHLNA